MTVHIGAVYILDKSFSRTAHVRRAITISGEIGPFIIISAFCIPQFARMSIHISSILF